MNEVAVMNKINESDKDYQKDLGDGLILRRAIPQDSDALTDFNGRIHGPDDSEEPEERVAVWTRDLFERPHPTFEISDFTLVVDTKTDTIVSSLNLISQTWSYAGINFKVGRPELVGTDPEFRGRGLIRAQFEQIHQWSSKRGEMLQAITGIPYYYRLFGYEMALDLGGGRAGFRSQIPQLDEGQDEPFRIRPASETDLTFLVDLYAQASQRYLVSCFRDKSTWHYELNGKSPQNVNRTEIKIIETESGDPVGYFLHSAFRWGAMMAATGYEIKPGISWAAVTPTVIRYLCSIGEEYPTESGEDKEFGEFGFWLGGEHPVYKVIPDRLPRVRHPYAWYLRVPNLPAFIRHIASELEARLADSFLVGYSGVLKITFYHSGLRLVFKQGRLVEVDDWNPTPHGHSGEAGFPELTFLQLVFGYRNLEELKYAFADCWTKSDQISALLEALFPKRASRVWPIS
jgi:hypothetical protein